MAVAATTSLDGLLRDVHETNKRGCRDVDRLARDTTLLNVCLGKTREETEKGYLSKPAVVAEDALRSKILPPRFVIKECHGVGDAASKFRVIDNLRASKINDTCAFKETYRPRNLNFLSCLTKTRVEYGKHLQMFSMYFKSEYKHLGRAGRDIDHVNMIIKNPVCEELMYSEMHTPPFGSRASPSHWGRTVALLQYLMRVLVGCVCGIYVDDTYCVEPAETITVGMKA